jgi:DNA-binding MarR family transcriptional regulator
MSLAGAGPASYDTSMSEPGAPGAMAAQVIGALHAVEGRLEEALEPLGLSLAKFGVLAKLVGAGEPLPLSTLADQCACVRSNITQLVDRLEADRLVRRAPDPRDRRSIRAELTAEGRARHDAGLGAIEKAERDLFTALPAQRRNDFLEVLRSLRDCR